MFAYVLIKKLKFCHRVSALFPLSVCRANEIFPSPALIKNEKSFYFIPKYVANQETFACSAFFHLLILNFVDCSS